MAKLNKEKAEQAAAAESSSFDPIPDGAYHVRLRDVDTSREGKAGPYWSWEYEVVDGEHKSRRLWNNTSLSEAAMFKVKETFDAFGVETDTDTDDLLGSVVKVIVSTRTIQQGARKGEPANQIDRVVPKDEDFEVPEAESQPTAEDIFG